MKLAVSFIAAFTNKAFKGNPAAVIVLDDWLSVDLMQSIATENNLSETAFLVKRKANNNNDVYDIRWFSPMTEIDFCGHATLASAFVLFSHDENINNVIFSAPAVGEVNVLKQANGFMQMDFPNRKPKKIEAANIPKELLAGLTITPTEIYVNQQAYFAIYNDEQDVINVQQNTNKLKQLAPLDVVVTSPSTEYDFISRYFWPANGGDEDPVTGSIHAGLVPLWAEKLAKNTLNAYQASLRGGDLYCSLKGERVFISGQAVSYLQGVIDV